MSTAPIPEAKREIRIISHSTLFYWWPVWATGFILALVTRLGGYHMAIVPPGTTLEKNAEITVRDEKAGKKNTFEERSVLVSPKAKELSEPKLFVTQSRNPGILFCTVLLLVVVITNVPLRGLWSVIVIFFIVSLSIIFALLGWWDHIFEAISLLDIRINLGGYLFISITLLIIWLIIFIFFDKQIYMVFTPGQFRVRLEIGDAETAYDTTGMTIQKQRSDLFRHWILGLGSGDLIVRTAGAQAHTFDMPNVLFLGRKVKEIEDMLRSRQVVAGPG